MSLAEESDDLVAGLEALHLTADGNDFACTVRAGNDIWCSPE